MLTTYEEYLYLVEGKQQEASQMWQMARWIGRYNEMLSPYIKGPNKHKRPEDIFRLAGETEKPAAKGHISGRIDTSTLDALTAIYEDFYKNKQKE